MEVDFENIMDQESSDEEMLSDDSECANDMSEYEIDRVEKFVQPSEIRMLNARTKHCVVHNYYTTGGALTVYTACMIRIADINDVRMYHVKKLVLSVGWTASRARIAEDLCTVYSHAACAHSAHIQKKLL